jgi:hypothetical protein
MVLPRNNKHAPNLWYFDGVPLVQGLGPTSSRWGYPSAADRFLVGGIPHFSVCRCLFQAVLRAPALGGIRQPDTVLYQYCSPIRRAASAACTAFGDLATPAVCAFFRRLTFRFPTSRSLPCSQAGVCMTLPLHCSSSFPLTLHIDSFSVAALARHSLRNV